MNNCLIAQSGGPTTAINASLAGVINAVEKSEKFDKVYGLLNGITGIFDNRDIDLTERFSSQESLERLKVSPAMFLGSCRFKLPPFTEDSSLYEKIFDFFEEKKIGAFFYIGGNDSMDTVAKLSEYADMKDSSIRIIGIPKTIDNDLCEIDHTPGFGSAAKYVATSVLEVAHDTAIYKLKSVTIVEIMGRDAGWLTAASALARNRYSMAPHLIYLPEVAFDKEMFLCDVKKLLEERDNIVVAVSEGIRDNEGRYISASNETDIFGHSQLNGAGKALEFLIKKELGVKVRSIEINVLQRCAAHLASLTDIEESYELGRQAVLCAEVGETAVMVNMVRTNSLNCDYQVAYGDVLVKCVANQVKSVPLDYINEAHNDVTDKMLAYLRPLIQGEAWVQYKDGLPEYVDISHL